MGSAGEDGGRDGSAEGVGDRPAVVKRFWFETPSDGHWSWHVEAEEVARFDRVLVDAECTHDGSVKHVAKFAVPAILKTGAAVWGMDSLSSRCFDPARMATLQDLQRGLLLNGFRHLREGGRLVYSTCSFAAAQNEEVVQHLLETEPAARLVPVEGRAGFPCRDGGLGEGTLRFDPATSGTSGLFVALLTKAACPPSDSRTAEGSTFSHASAP